MSAKSKLALAGLLAAGLLVAQPSLSHAVTIDEMVQETMGAPVYASDGHEVGKVVDVSVSDDGEIDAVRPAPSSALANACSPCPRTISRSCAAP